MLFYIYLMISAAAAVGSWLLSGKAWWLPVGFVGCFVGLVILFALVMLIMALFVDMKKPQEKDNRFYRWMTHRLVELAMPILRIRLHTQGMENLPDGGRCLVVCNHLHELDPVFLLRAFPKMKLAFISKQEVDRMFLVGQFLHKIMGQPINRENDREALKTILNCVRLIKEDMHSVAVFPEGYIKPDHQLHRFRSGVFKIAQRTKVPIVVCTLRNTHNIMHNFLRFKKTDVHLHLVGTIGPEQWEGATTVDIAGKAYDMMAEDLGPDLVWQE